ncbi:hypothetical protein ACY2DF_09570 [Enterococcus durans]|uniref:hypothetical protein n=1 Tax=Enterococcus durans TaxID=53345 RepID=UPI001D0B2E18|nr:hypothetical protein [Enterococcus durans]MCB8505393.1 hypothetical protein [Enterococcus durans]MCB8514837.1 hypothetical protein [Enterococcus durans]MDT2771989.1 hypothetical protein [Enterococcus durans]
MRNYWYVSLSNDYPQPHNEDPTKIVQSVQMKKKYSVIEMTREAEPNEIDAFKLIYCGHGYWKDDHIQENIRRCINER